MDLRLQHYDAEPSKTIVVVAQLIYCAKEIIFLCLHLSKVISYVETNFWVASQITF